MGRVLGAVILVAGVVLTDSTIGGAVVGTNIAGFDVDAEIEVDATLDDWAANSGSGDHVVTATREGDGSCTLDPSSEGVLICDDVKSDSDIFVGGNKESDPSKWAYKTGQVTPKTDITNVYALGRIDGSGDPVLINGMERLPKSGSLNLDFEFNKDVDAATNVPIRQEDDVLIAYDLGGARSSDVGAISVKVFKADSNGEYDYDHPDVQLSGSGTLSGAGVTALLNTGSINCGDWQCYDDHYSLVNTLPAFSFAEAGINLNDAVGLSDACFNFVTVRSRASESISAQLKDTTEPTDFPFCGGLEVRKYLDVDHDGVRDDPADIDTAAEDTQEDLDGWAMTVRGPAPDPSDPASDPGPLVCSGTTNSAGVLECGAGQDLSQLLPGTYTVTETVSSGFYNTDPGGSSPYSKVVDVTLGAQQTVYMGNTCYVDKTFKINNAPTGADAPTSVTVEYDVDDSGTWTTLALSQSGSTWEATVSDQLKPGQSVDWRWYINGDTANKRTGASDVALPDYPTCTKTNETNFPFATLNGSKYKDGDADGTKDAGEGPLSGFTFELWRSSEYGVSGKTAVATTTSSAAGTYSFTNVPPGTYVVDEVSIPTGWVQTEPASAGTQSVTVDLGDTSVTIDPFGNTPLSRIDVDFTSLADLPGSTNDATEATSITCYTGYGTASQTQVGTTTTNSLSVTNLKTSDSSVTCVVSFEDP